MVVPAEPAQPSLHTPCAGAVKLGQISDDNRSVVSFTVT